MAGFALGRLPPFSKAAIFRRRCGTYGEEGEGEMGLGPTPGWGAEIESDVWEPEGVDYLQSETLDQTRHSSHNYLP